MSSRSVKSRMQRAPDSAERILRYNDLTVDVDRFRVVRAGRPLQMSHREYQLLCLFLRHPGEILSRKALIAAAWPSGAKVTAGAFDMHIHRLRQALNVAREAELIHTVLGKGHMLW
jgi:DNA-binding response OmpR family regulator